MTLVLLLNAMASSPELHEFFHADAGHADHECAVTLFAHGQVESPVMDMAAIVPVATVEFLPQISVSVPIAVVESLPPGRGPPVSSLHS